MINNISINVLQNVSNYIEKTLGLYFHEKRYNDLKRALSNAAKLKSVDTEEYISSILLNTLSQDDFKDLVACLTIGETYFFRDKKLFSAMKQKILPALINSKKNTNRSFKIWSAGCSSGEEVYSIAILIKELIKDYKDWNIKIIATDINYYFLSKAKKAVYSEWSFRGVDLNIKNKYFKKIDNNHYKLNKEIVDLVEFHSLNLADSTYLIDNQIINNVDIIFCRNVLMYFSKLKINEIIDRFYNIITNEGGLIVAPTESIFLNDTSFIPVKIDDVFLYNKNVKEIQVGGSYNDFYNTEYKSLLPVLENIKIQEKQLKEDRRDSKKLETIFRSYANEGKLEEAIESCKNAIILDKTNSYYYYFLASIQQEQGNINEAIVSLRKCIFLEYDFIMAYFHLGNLNLKQEKYEEAFKNFKIVCGLLNNFDEKEIIPYSEEMTVGCLKKIIENINWRRTQNRQLLRAEID